MLVGDAPDDKSQCRWFDLECKMMFDAWTEYKGWTAQDAMAEFVATCKSILEENEISWEDPEKKSMAAAYQKCMEESEMIAEPILVATKITPELQPDQ